MGIWDRLGTVIKSYLNDDVDKASENRFKMRGDPDLDAAYEELDDYLAGKGGREKPSSTEETAKKQKAKPVPEELKKDFAELGLTQNATPEECKEAYKRLLKIHHPDRHTKHNENMNKATEKSTRINAAYERLVGWFRLQNQS
jgi:curved DNA-binding protein CbpA